MARDAIVATASIYLALAVEHGAPSAPLIDVFLQSREPVPSKSVEAQT
jgi:hypothetical protein